MIEPAIIDDVASIAFFVSHQKKFHRKNSFSIEKLRFSIGA